MLVTDYTFRRIETLRPGEIELELIELFHSPGEDSMCKSEQAVEMKQPLAAVMSQLENISDHLNQAIDEFVRNYGYNILTEKPLDRQATVGIAEISGLGRMLHESVEGLKKMILDGSS
jgi:hypothetical protein